MAIDVARVGRLWNDRTKACVEDVNSVLHHVRVFSPALALANPETRTSCQALVDFLVDSVLTTPPNQDPSNNGWFAAIPLCLRGNLAKSVEYLCMLIAVDFRHWAEADEQMPADVGSPVKQKNFYAVVPTENQHERNHSEKDAPSLVRGSAAMVHLLREAVDAKQVPWYDSHYLRNPALDLIELERIFVGVEADGRTPMMMPAAKERIAILREIAENLNGKTFLDHILESKLRLYNPPDNVGFIDRLIKVHARYDDSVNFLGRDGHQYRIHLLKLAQLTVIALQAAFPHDICFSDFDEICVCSDYQLPKALRAAGLIVYDEHLAGLVDGKRLLKPESIEEVEIRVASTIGATMLMDWVNSEALPKKRCAVPPPRYLAARCDVGSLDYALWYFGRSNSEQPHHLCRTLMY